MFGGQQEELLVVKVKREKETRAHAYHLTARTDPPKPR